MIRKSLALSVAQCCECGAIMVYSPAAQGLPSACQKCGVPYNVELTKEERQQLDRQQQQTHVHTMRF